MTSMASTKRAAVFAVLLLAGCKRDRDPRHFDLGDFNSGKQLTDTLTRLLPPGTRLNLVWEVMQGNGFGCGERAATTVDIQKGTLGSGKPYLECYKSTRIDLGLKRRDWTVMFNYDSSGVRDINSGYIIQP